jgi:hypothetical protein
MHEDKPDHAQKEKLTGVVSASQLEDVLAASGKQTADIIAAAIVQARQPNVAEAKKLRQEELLAKRAVEARREEAIKSQEGRDKRIRDCRAAGHVIAAPGAKGAVRHGFRGTVNGDGCIRAMCIACGLVCPPFKAPQAAVQGASVNEWFEKTALTEDVLVKWSKTSNPEYWAAKEKKEKERADWIAAFRAENEAAGLTA